MTIRVLLADDHSVLRDGLAALLAAQDGITVVAHAQDGREAVRKVIEFKPDVAIMDIVMPELDGIEAIRRIRTDYPGLRVIAMSGGGQIDKADFLHMAEALGADRVLEKPVRSERLLELVGSVMANPPRRLPERKS